MRFTNQKDIGGTVEILVGLTAMHTLTPIKVATPGSGNVVKAGTPLGEDGAVANSSSAFGILLYDVYPAENPNGTVIQSGPIDAGKAQKHCGLTYDAGVASALPGVIFRNNIGAQGATGATGATGVTGATGATNGG